MRILHLEASSGWGGQEIRILKEAEGMRQRGHEVFFVVMKGGKLHQAACKAGFTSYELSFYKKSWPFSLFRLIYWICHHQIDCINTHSSLDAWLGGIAARLTKRKVVRTRHLSTAIRKGLNSKLLYRFLADRVVTTCEEVVPMILEQSGQKKAFCSSIPTGIDEKKMKVDPQESLDFRKKLGVSSDQFLVGTACFMRSWKGIQDFLLAADLLRENSSIRWVLIGGGHETFYREEAKRLRLEGIVHFTGHLENPLPAIQALDLFALLSTANEGVSQAILQAAYLEKPLLATATGGLKEVCLEGVTGKIVPCFSPKEVAEAVVSFEQDKAFSKRLGKAARRLVEEKFLYQKMLDQMEKVFTELHLP